jgi:hypothetical protein
MKLVPLVLIGSLAINTTFVALYVIRSQSATHTVATSTSPATKTAAKSAASPNSAATAETAALAKVWTQLQSGDLASLVARLRDAGFSSSVIRSIVMAQINEQFSARRRAIMGDTDDRPFWKSRTENFRDPKIAAALRDLNKEQNTLMKSLLEADGALGNEDALTNLRRQFGNLPPEKLAQLRTINSDYSELTQEVYEKTRGITLPEDREKIAFLEKEKRADLEKILGPQGYEDFQLRNSSTANQLRFQLSSFDASEAEFRAIFKLQAAFDEQYSFRNGPPSPELMQSRAEAQKQLQASILATLPPDRAADYQRATDPKVQQATQIAAQVDRLVARLELPPATTQQVVAVQQDIEQRARALQTNRELPAAERTAQLTALNQEATAKLSTALTPRGLEAYKQNGGQWLQSLQPRPAGLPVGARPAVRFRPGN